MLPSFAELRPDRVVLFLGADSLLAVEQHGWQRRRAAELRLPLRLQDGLPQLDLLAQWLGERRARRLEVRLSSAWVRFAILPWQTALSDETVAQAMAQALFAEQYGAASAGWEVTLSPFKPGSARVASALDGRWLAALRELAEQQRYRLVSMQPVLVSLFNRLADKLPQDALLAVVEPRRLALLQLQGGQWASLYNRVLPEPWERRLPSLITQASATLDALNSPVYIAAPLFQRPDLGRLSATWLRLPAQRGYDPRRDPEWALCTGV